MSRWSPASAILHSITNWATRTSSCRTPATSCCRSIASGTSSNTGFHTAICSNTVGTSELTAFIPRIALAADAAAYKRELLAFIATVHDTHANLWSSLDVRPPVGTCTIPVNLRFIENQAVVTGYTDAASGSASGLKPGDVVTALDGDPVTQLVERWSPFYAASNQPRRLHDIAASMMRGTCGAVSVRVSRDGGPHRIESRAHSATAAKRDATALARSAGRDVSKAIPGDRVSQTLVRQGVSGSGVHRGRLRHEGPDHRRSKLPV